MAGNIGALFPETGPRSSLPDLAKYLDQRRHALSYALNADVQLINPDRLILGGDLPSSALHQFKERIDLTPRAAPAAQARRDRVRFAGRNEPQYRRRGRAACRFRLS